MPDVQPARDAAALASSSTPIEFFEIGRPVDEPSPARTSLSLADAIERALRVDPRIQVALAQVRVAQADARQARLLPNPILNVAFRWPEGGGSPVIEAGLAADLFSVLSIRGRTSAADSRLRAASADVLTAALDVVADVRAAYLAASSTDALGALLNKRAALLDRLLTVTRDRLEVGEGTRLDVLSLESQRIDLAAEIDELALRRHEHRLTLARLIGEPSAAAEWTLDPIDADADVAPESAWIARALVDRPDIQRQQHELAALGVERRLSRVGWLEGSDVGVDAERDGDWSVGPAVAVPLPIFDVGQARSARARAIAISAQHELTRLERAAIEDVRRAYAAWTASQAALERIERDLIPVDEQRLTQANEQFRAGTIDVTQLLDAEARLPAARARRVELIQRQAEARLRLERAAGGRPPTTNGKETK